MNKEEVLLKSRIENQKGDERNQMIAQKADTIGGIVLSISIFILYIINKYFQQSTDNLIFLLAIFVCAAMAYRAFYSKNNKFYIISACFGIAAIIYFIKYIQVIC